MLEFLKKLGKSSLNILVLPAYLIILVIYTVISLIGFIFMTFKSVVLFFTGRSLYEDLPEDKKIKELYRISTETQSSTMQPATPSVEISIPNTEPVNQPVAQPVTQTTPQTDVEQQVPYQQTTPTNSTEQAEQNDYINQGNENTVKEQNETKNASIPGFINSNEPSQSNAPKEIIEEVIPMYDGPSSNIVDTTPETKKDTSSVDLDF